MGYEVLDSSGRATDLPEDARPRPVDVLDLDGAVRVSDAEGRLLVSATTRPAGPVVVLPGGLRDVRLTVRVTRCLLDAAAVTGVGYLTFDTTSTDPGAATGGQGVDVGPLVGVALARACSR